MNNLSASQAERAPEAQWQVHDIGKQRISSFTFLNETGDLAMRHYDSAPVVEGDRRRLASFVHLGFGAKHVDMQPDGAGWSFSVQGLGRRIGLERLAVVTDALLHNTEPDTKPIAKGIGVLDPHVKFHPNQSGLLEEFDSHVVYEDADMLALYKPPHVSAHWDPHHHIGAAEIAKERRGARLDPVHRLDRLTSGVLLFGKTKQAIRNLSGQFALNAATQLEKGYVAIVDGDFEEDRYIECFLDRVNGKMAVNTHGRSGKLAKTAAAKIAGARSTRGEKRSVLAVQILTGRTHQIRASLAHVGKPIVDDPLYNGRSVEGRMRLHAAYLKIQHPQTESPVVISAPLPPDFFTDMDTQERSYVEHALAELQPGNPSHTEQGKAN